MFHYVVVNALIFTTKDHTLITVTPVHGRAPQCAISNNTFL